MKTRRRAVSLAADVWEAVLRLLRRSVAAPVPKDQDQTRFVLDRVLWRKALDELERGKGDE